MTLPLNPPTLEIPSAFAEDAEVGNFLDALLRTLYRIWKELYSIRTGAKVTTTDATPKAAQYISVPTNKTVFIDSIVVARRSGGSSGSVGDSAWYRLQGGFKNIAGTLSIIGSNDLIGGEDQAGWNVQYASSGETIALTVTGAANNNITWETTVSAYEVGI